MALSVGDKLGPYEILAPIGAGGMGEVWKARDTRLNRIVAIKRLKGQHTARFEQEARAIAALNHPHICQLYDIGSDYLVLEYVEGDPPKGPLPPAQAVRLALEIAGALEEAHRHGILHRDLKPTNILVTERGGAKVLDFGLAKLMAGADTDVTQTIEGTVLGTPAYMSPEQAEGKPADARSEIFSFGAVLYEILSGNRAFRGNSTGTVLSAVLRDEPAPLQTTGDLQRIVSKCLSKKPEDRFPSMAELRVALEQIGASRPADQKASIAVLPFVNMSRDPDDEYFSDGLAEEIINVLVKVPGLKVIARTSAFAFKGQNTDIRKIAETLGVANVLEGSVRRAGNRLRITAQLITAADGSHLWSERYDRELADVFAVQDEISTAIAGALHTKLSPQPAAKLRYTPNLPAYEALLKAKHFHWKVTAESMDQARQFYEEAIALDPQFALAYASYADYLGGRAVLGLAPAHEALPAARALAQRALELDPSLPEAHILLCFVAAMYDYDWKEAAHRFTLTMADDSASPWCHMVRGWSYFLALGRPEEAVRVLDLAVQADPLHLTYRVILATCLGAAGRFAEAEHHLRQARDLDPNFFWAYYFFADLYAARQMFVEALPFAEKAYSLAPWYAPGVGVYAGLMARTGEEDRASEVLQKLGSGVSYGTSTGFATYYICRGEIDLAADWFEKAIEERYSMVALFLQGAIGESLRASPRWPKLARMMNLPDSV